MLFAYRAAEQQSTLESAFFLLYGCDLRLPREVALCPEERKKLIDLREYKSELAVQMSDAWRLARDQVKCTQKRQRIYCDRKPRPPQFFTDNRVFLHKPAEKTGEGRKLERPYHGPYQIIELTVNNAQIRRIDMPHDEPIQVALDRLRRCPVEVPGEFQPPKSQESKQPSRVKLNRRKPQPLQR